MVIGVLLMAIGVLLMAIGGHFINGYWWSFY